MGLDVLCIGHAAYDLSAFVEKFPEENSKCETRDLLESGGGPAANAAYLLSSWGVRSGFAGVVGDDHYGRRIGDEFRSVGTDISLLEFRADHPTPLSLIWINTKNGSRTIVNRKAQGSPCRPEPAALLSVSPRLILMDGHELSASLEALRTFPHSDSVLDAGSWREGTEILAGRVKYLVASQRFAMQAAGMCVLKTDSQRQECLRRLRQQYSTTVVVTLGENGLIADDGRGFRHLPAFPAQVVDTTAAGDIFHGAFAYAQLQKMSFWEALRFSSMAAALSVAILGGRSSIPTLFRVQEALTHAE